MEKISIVIPCYNEEECIEIYYNEMEKVVSKLDCDFEYIFVNDGSKDSSLQIMKKIASINSNVKYISFSRNFGKEAAIYAGLCNATGDYVGLMDVDLQDPPALLIDMYKGIKEEGYDCVASRRVTRKGEPPIRSMFARMFYWIINKISDAEITNGARDFRLMTRPMVDAIISLSERDRFSKGIFGWVGFDIKWLEYENVDRVAGKTKWSFKKLTKYAIGGIEDFSSVPLKINLFFMYVFIFATLALGGWMIANYFFLDKVIPIYLSIGTMICGVSIFIFAGLSVISAYIKKIYKESKHRPIYIIKEKN